MTYKIDINIADDHTMLVEGLVETINRSEIAHVSHCFSTLDACRQKLEERRPDVLLLDLSMPDGSGIEFCESLLSDFPQMKIVAMTCHDEYSVIRRMLDIGVQGYVLKSAPVEELLQAVHKVYHGEKYVSPAVDLIISRAREAQMFLTPAEHKVLQLICEGMTNTQIAESLCISQATASWYRKRLLTKFHVSNSTSLVALALREHLVGMP